MPNNAPQGSAQAPIASSERESALPGQWVDLGYPDLRGAPIGQVRELPAESLYLPELTERGELQPEKRAYLAPYIARLKAGERPPLVDAVEMEDGRIRVVDGHRRALAAKAAGQPLRVLVSPLVDLPGDGKVPLTRELAAAHPEQLNSAIGSSGDFDPASPDIRFSRRAAPEKPESNLVLVHNLSAANLLHAHQLGGLAAPSLAISRLDAPLDGFGEITLLGDARLATPQARNPVFDADVYSPRFPRIKVKVDENAVRAALNPLMEAAAKMGHHARRSHSAVDELKRNNLGNACADISYDVGMRLGYAKVILGKTLSVPMKDVEKRPVAKAGASLIEQSPLLELMPTLDISELTEQTAGDLGQKVYAALMNKTLADLSDETETAAGFDKAMQMVNRRIRMFAVSAIEPNSREFAPDKIGAMKSRGLYMLHNLVRNALPREANHEGAQQEVDLKALNELLDKEAPREDFESWLQGTISKTMGERRVVKENGRTAAYTMAEIVREMTRKVRDAEGFNYGLGNARSKGAKKFKNLRQLQQSRDRIASKEQFDLAKKEFDQELSALVRQLTPYQRYKQDSSYELLAEAIGNSYGAPIGQALKSAALDDVPQELRERIEQFAQALVNAPTEYFEAKPQRAVGLDEFRGAVIPSNASKEVRAVLQKHGLRLQEYDSAYPQSRRAAVSSMAKMLQADNGDVIFSRAEIEPSSSQALPITPLESDARLAAAESLVAEIRAKWSNCPPIVVARHIQDERIGAAVHDSDARMARAGAGQARGFFQAGTVYLLSDALPTPSAVAQTLFHEALGHYGLRGLFGQALTPVLEQIVAERRDDVLMKAGHYRLEINDANLLIAAEEVLADMAQSRPELGIVERATTAIRNWLRAIVPGCEDMRLTDNDIIANYIIPARDFVERGYSARDLEPAQTEGASVTEIDLTSTCMERNRA